ncbi:rod shape-determining protein MreD [Nocardioides sp.]|uniref:rod shape-determining protein MreD n=1 Tax=Nocardioides sp. TaxID=35761 RepID=UPI0035270879
MTAARGVVAALMAVAALVLQTTVLPLLSGGTTLPNLCLLVVVAVGLSAGETAGSMTGFAVGLALDLTPPADHLAGRWALALAVAGFLAGLFAAHQPEHAAPSRPTRRARAEALLRVLLVTAAASFVATSVFALTGLLYGDLGWAVPELLRGVGVAVGLDAVAGLLLVPLLLRPLVVHPVPVAVLGGAR